MLPDRAGNPCGTASFSINLPPLEGESANQGRSPRIFRWGEKAVPLHAEEGGALLPDRAENTFGTASCSINLPSLSGNRRKPGPPARPFIHLPPLVRGSRQGKGAACGFSGGGRRSFRFTRRREGPCCRTGPGTNAAWPPTRAFGRSPPARHSCASGNPGHGPRQEHSGAGILGMWYYETRPKSSYFFMVGIWLLSFRGSRE